ncbi:hypothetical protein ACJMK2_005876, partial [Sinanodonta woodiana]
MKNTLCIPLFVLVLILTLTPSECQFGYKGGYPRRFGFPRPIPIGVPVFVPPPVGYGFDDLGAGFLLGALAGGFLG